MSCLTGAALLDALVWTGVVVVIDELDHHLLQVLATEDQQMVQALAPGLSKVQVAIAPKGFTAAQFTDKVHSLTGQTAADYTIRQAAYDLRKLRAKALISKPGRWRRYFVPPAGARTISALLTLRNQVIVPLLAGMRSPRLGHPPSILTPADRHYEKLRIDMEALFTDLGIAAAASLPIADRQAASLAIGARSGQELLLPAAGATGIRPTRGGDSCDTLRATFEAPGEGADHPATIPQQRTADTKGQGEDWHGREQRTRRQSGTAGTVALIVTGPLRITAGMDTMQPSTCSAPSCPPRAHGSSGRVRAGRPRYRTAGPGRAMGSRGQHWRLLRAVGQGLLQLGITVRPVGA